VPSSSGMPRPIIRRSLRDDLAVLATRARRLRAQGDDAPAILHQVLDELPFAALVIDNTGHFLYANDAASQLTGYTPTQLLRLSVWEVTPSVKDHETEVLWRAFLDSGEQNGRYTVLNKAGQTIATTYAAVANFLPSLHLALLSTAPA
jgi:PAS domain S-box-containing protein